MWLSLAMKRFEQTFSVTFPSGNRSDQGTVGTKYVVLCFYNTDYEFNVQEEQFTALLKKAKGKLPSL